MNLLFNKITFLFILIFFIKKCYIMSIKKLKIVKKNKVLIFYIINDDSFDVYNYYYNNYL